jgi:hypothetical protein
MAAGIERYRFIGPAKNHPLRVSRDTFLLSLPTKVAQEGPAYLPEE